MRYALVLLLCLGARANADEHADREVKIAALRADKKVARLAWSAYLCAAREWRGGTLDAIAEEKKYARIGGAIDLAKMHSLQETLRSIDAWIVDAKADLRDRKLMPLSCKRDDVIELAECWDVDGNRTCDDLRAAIIEGAPVFSSDHATVIQQGEGATMQRLINSAKMRAPQPKSDVDAGLMEPKF